MGFSVHACRRAALATGNAGAHEAIEWCLTHSDDPNFDSPLDIQAGWHAGFQAAAEAGVPPVGNAPSWQWGPDQQTGGQWTPYAAHVREKPRLESPHRECTSAATRPSTSKPLSGGCPPPPTQDSSKIEEAYVGGVDYVLLENGYRVQLGARVQYKPETPERQRAVRRQPEGLH